MASVPAASAVPSPSLDRHARALIARIRKNWNDVDAIRGLATHYRKHNDYASLANLMEGWGDSLKEDARGAADAYVEAADALLMSARPGDEARLLYERALSRDASHVQALDRLTRVLEEHRNYDRLKQVLKYVAHQLQQNPSSRQLLASVHFRLGQVYETYFGEPRKAATLYRQAIEGNPRLITAISAARRLYLEQANHKTVSVLYELEIEATPNSEDKHALLLALARHKREACDDLDGAVLAFRRAVKQSPSSVRALFGLGETLLARSERTDELAATADRQRAGEVFFHLAQRVPPNDAVPYLQRALLVVPNHAQARALLDSLQPNSRPVRTVAPAANGGAEARASAEAWLQEGELQIDDVSSAELLPIEEDVPAARVSAQPPQPLARPVSGPVVKPRPPAASPSPQPPVAAAQPKPPAAPLHPKIVAMLADDPARVVLDVNVGSTTDSNFYVDGSDDLLEGGVFVATYSPLPIGALLALTITLPGKVVARAHGKVVLTRDLSDAFDDHTPGMCVEFEALDPKSAALVERFTRKRAPMFVEG